MDNMQSGRYFVNNNEHHDNQNVQDLYKEYPIHDISNKTETKSELFKTTNDNIQTDKMSTSDYVYILDIHGSCGINHLENAINADCSGVEKLEMRKNDELHQASRNINDIAKNTGKSNTKRTTLECTVTNIAKNESNAQLPLIRKGSKRLDVLVKEMTDNAGKKNCQKNFNLESSASTNACTEGCAGKNSFTGSSVNNSLVTKGSASIASFKTSKRKRSIPLQCDKSKLENGNIKEFVGEYVDTKETCSSTTSQQSTGDCVPNSLTDHNVKSESELGYARIHHGADFSIVMPKNAAHDCEPIDLSISKKNQNGTKTSNTDITQRMTPINMIPFYPDQMQQYVDYMTKMSTEYQNQGLLHPAAAHALYFQFMLHHSMRNMMDNGAMPMPTSFGGGAMSMQTSTGGRHNKHARISLVPNVNDKPQEFLKVNNEQLQNNATPQDDNTEAVVNSADKNDGSVPAAEIDHSTPNQGKKVQKPRMKHTCISKLDGIPLNDGNSVRDHFVINNLRNLFPVNTNGTITLDDQEHFKFFVKDNDQIQTILNSLVEFGNLERSAESDTENVNDMKHICRACNNVFFHAEHLIKHVKKHHILKKYACEECYRSFHDAGNYRQHKRVHDESDIPFECQYCHEFFRHKATLTVHVRTHTGEKPYNCEVCGAQFKISSGLQTHMRKHTGETPYACEFCSQRFKCQSNLKQHMFQHTQARPFRCEVCGKSYSRKSIRDKHMAKHSNNLNSCENMMIKGSADAVTFEKQEMC